MDVTLVMLLMAAAAARMEAVSGEAETLFVENGLCKAAPEEKRVDSRALGSEAVEARVGMAVVVSVGAGGGGSTSSKMATMLRRRPAVRRKVMSRGSFRSEQKEQSTTRPVTVIFGGGSRRPPARRVVGGRVGAPVGRCFEDNESHVGDYKRPTSLISNVLVCFLY